jgi:hypothetical protein
LESQVTKRKADLLTLGTDRGKERALVLQRLNDEEEAAAAGRVGQMRLTEEQAALALAACEADLGRAMAQNDFQRAEARITYHFAQCYTQAISIYLAWNTSHGIPSVHIKSKLKGGSVQNEGKKAPYLSS